MRRALSILLMLLFGAEPLSFAFNLSEDISLPACCRRHGAHHCAMDAKQSQTAPGNTLKARSRCEQYPQHPNARTSSSASFSGSYLIAERDPEEFKCSAPVITGITSIHLSSPVLRGPPAYHLS